MRSCRSLAAAVAVIVLVAGCGDGESDEEVVVGALTESLLADDTFADYEIDEAEAGCVAQTAVDELGTERMLEIGFTDTDGAEIEFSSLPDDEIEVLGGAMEDCLSDIDALLVDALSAGILEEQDAAFPVDDAEATCIAERVSADISLTRLILIGVQGDRTGTDGFEDLEPEETAVFTDAFVGCIDVRTILLDSIATGGAPDDVLVCLDANITDDDIAALFSIGFSGGDPDAAAEEILTPAVEACT